MGEAYDNDGNTDYFGTHLILRADILQTSLFSTQFQTQMEDSK